MEQKLLPASICPFCGKLDQDQILQCIEDWENRPWDEAEHVHNCGKKLGEHRCPTCGKKLGKHNNKQYRHCMEHLGDADRPTARRERRNHPLKYKGET